MKTEEIVGADKVFDALLDGRALTGAGGLTMRLKDGLLIVSDGPRVLHLDLDNMRFTYPVPELKHGGKYKARCGACVLLCATQKNMANRGRGLYSTKTAWKRHCTLKTAVYTVQSRTRWIL